MKNKIGENLPLYPLSESEMKELMEIRIGLDESTAVAMTDAKGIITYANKMFCHLSGYSKEELVGKTHRIINSGYHSKAFFRNMWKTIQKGEIWRGSIQNKGKTGRLYWVQCTIVPFLNDKGIPYKYIAFRTEITKHKKMEEKIHHMAYYDQLTRLPNRNGLKKEYERLIPISKKKKEKLSFLVIDIDRFKNINDTLGHEIGDALLKLIAKRLKKIMKDEHVISRESGDQFYVLLKGMKTFEQIIGMVEKLITRFEKPFRIKGYDLIMTPSIGISSSPEDGVSFDDLERKADLAMYQAQKLGGNTFWFYETELGEKYKQKWVLENQLRKAIKENELLLYYQPKIDIQQNKLMGAEALVRWNSPMLGLISPANFIPLAEETGLILSMGNWILKEACRQNKAWQQCGYPPIRIAVNLSVCQFQQKNFIDEVKQILKETELDPHYLELEITEGMAMLNTEQVLNTLHTLKEMGISISIDDFGTGYSSLSYLKKYPIQHLKIDQSFIRNLDVNAQDKGITETIITLAQSLQLEVVAEGVENEKQLKFLKERGCHMAQGYYLSKPLPPQEMTYFLTRCLLKCKHKLCPLSELTLS